MWGRVAVLFCALPPPRPGGGAGWSVCVCLDAPHAATALLFLLLAWLPPRGGCQCVRTGPSVSCPRPTPPTPCQQTWAGGSRRITRGGSRAVCGVFPASPPAASPCWGPLFGGRAWGPPAPCACGWWPGRGGLPAPSCATVVCLLLLGSPWVLVSVSGAVGCLPSMLASAFRFCGVWCVVFRPVLPAVPLGPLALLPGSSLRYLLCVTSPLLLPQPKHDALARKPKQVEAERGSVGGVGWRT